MRICTYYNQDQNWDSLHEIKENEQALKLIAYDMRFYIFSYPYYNELMSLGKYEARSGIENKQEFGK